ncbi:MAG: 30S ribosomal protein S20 [Candidatus Omnitrophica bacterium]|nr:30S ribosomal protein S20 [Candidatus Omnitrophota bacterium]
MPRRRTSIKKTRVDKKRHLRNLKIKRELKKALKSFQELLQAKNTAEARTLLAKIFSQLDKAAKKQVIHQKLASRKKSRLAKSLSKAA